MTWFWVDDHLHSHPKPRRLGRTWKDRLPAIGLWTVCGSWCADTTSDGWVPAETVRQFDPRELLAGRLVAAKLWHPQGYECPSERCRVGHVGDDDEPGYQFHEWTTWQKTRDQILDQRDKRAAAGRVGGLRSGKARRSKTEANTEAFASPIVEAKSNPSPPLPSTSYGATNARGRARVSTTDQRIADAQALKGAFAHRRAIESGSA